MSGNCLSEAEIADFFNDCGPDEHGFVYQHKLDELFAEFRDGLVQDGDGAEYLDDGRWYMPENKRYVPPGTTHLGYDCAHFTNMVKSWQVPTMKSLGRKIDEKSKMYEASLPIGRRLRAHWSIEGPQSTFVMLVIALQTALAVWLMVRELNDRKLLDLLGWGLVVAKTSAGVLYPTLALLLLSSSRTLGTWLRQLPFLSKFVNWDLSQVFHMQMAITALFFSTLHVVAHLGGTFVAITRSSAGRTAATLHNFRSQKPRYTDLLQSLPGLTGIIAVAFIGMISLASLPVIRRRYFEVFQAMHLLVYPFIGLLVVHGTRGWLQAPMLGYWLAVPGLLLIGERCVRLYSYIVPVHATLVPQRSDVVMLILTRKRPWKVKPGQYILLCIPAISALQWHPFTISSFSDHEIRVHIRTTSGRWTSKVRTTDFDLAMVDGPFGSPAEKFFGFDRTVVIGTGIGITPYIGVLSNDSIKARQRLNSGHSANVLKAQSVDFHWIARDASVFSWFATLLNTATTEKPGVKVNTYLTSKQNSTAAYVFSVLVDRNERPIARVPASHLGPELSSLTGLRNKTTFGRPDFTDILERNEAEIPSEFTGTIGVFFCGPKYVGMEISDRCKEMSLRRRKVQWEFIGEVF
ncbi:Putative uncharacterized protein [Taphrina deformans PYCC 5710]|uniref:FAD-binding FR-type domain-containing protein n=1 Tax=Taphrina deformans (strain PYCC 5710 / ATCC 11124 / CBS 356.35 / IMI 108563 / JCM 9778 / NBRC 8474) TaxID=1097556 RepID=R4XG08_TAPDE|nr:Putative uncharacterized protein [Taphrina deformans PYCC 5710]|eukprot:CCG82319.1 Putative uncharacterized protein [Taphrina deformans PYCC 5710]